MENQPLIASPATDGGKQKRGYAPLLATVSSALVLFGLVVVYGGGYQRDSSRVRTANGVGVGGGGGLDLSAVLPPSPHPKEEGSCGSCYLSDSLAEEANCCNTCDEVKQVYQILCLKWPPNDGQAIPLCDIKAAVPGVVTPPSKCGSCYGTDQEMRCCNTCDDVQKAFNSFPSNIVPFHTQEIPQCGGTKIINGKSPLGFACKTDDDCMNGKCVSTTLSSDDDGHGFDPNNKLLCSYHEY